MDQRYTDHEVSLIIRRALEPTTEGEGLHSGGPGLSLEQIKGIAAEVGIDPHRIELAAANLLESTPVPVNPYVGIPTTVQFQTILPGMEVGEAARHDVVDLVRSTLGRQGIVGNESGSLEWRARDAFGGRYISLTPSREGARLRVLGNYRDGLGVLASTVGAVSFVGAAAVIAGFGLGPAGILLGAAAVAVLPPRVAYRWWRKKEDARMAALHSRLVALLNSSRSSDTFDAKGRSSDTP